MATVYKIEIETTSEWVNYPPQYFEDKLTEFFQSQKCVNTNIKIQ